MKIEANGITVHYELGGKQGAPVVAFSHSLGASLDMWEPQVPAFERDFRVLRFDTRGHGGTSAPPGPYSFDLLARDFVCLLDALGLEKVHFVGLSMGGMIGQALGIFHPERVERLCLCDTAAVTGAEGKKTWEDRIGTVRREGLSPLLEATMARWFTEDFLSRNPPMLQKIRRQFLATPPEGFLGCVGAIRELNFLDRLGEIKAPTLIVVGEEDPGTPVAAARGIHERVPGSELRVIPGAKHLPNVEKDGEFNRTVLNFLS